MSVLLGEVLARRVPVSVFWRYRVSLQRKNCAQQINGLNDESFSVAVCGMGWLGSTKSPRCGSAVAAGYSKLCPVAYASE